MTDYGTDFEDGVPVVAEGTTYNIHGGRDMFAKRSPTKSLSARNKPPIAKKPSLDKLRSRSLQRQSTLDRTGYVIRQPYKLWIQDERSIA